MLKIALKVLIGDKAKYIGIVLGLSFAAFIITQQAGIFVGIMSRTYGFIAETNQADIWVMDPKVQFIDDIKPLKLTDILRVRSIEDVEWAVPLYKGLLKAKLPDGNFQNCIVIGIDDSTLIAGPSQMLAGKLQDLRLIDGVIVNNIGAKDKLAITQSDGNSIPMQVGDVFELNDHRASVVGICKSQRTFQSQPVIYTTYNRAMQYAPSERKLLSFILVKAKKGASPLELAKKIANQTSLAAYTNHQFEDLTVEYYIKYTGIPLNFGIAVLLGIIIGAAIAGQTFYNFVLDNLKYLAVYKAIGAKNALLVKMTLLQMAWVGFIGWGLGTGSAALLGFFMKDTDLSFKLPWQLFLFSAVCIFIICTIATIISVRKIYKVEPALVFKA